MPRDGAGNFTLAPGNPVIPGTVIEAAWANPTLSDIAANLTDSLSRTGQGGMLVPFRNTDGTVGAPGMTWANEPSSGWYRAALNDFWYSVGNENIFRITKTTVELAPGKTLLLNGSTISGGVISGTSLNIASGIIVASAPAINVTQTWNNAAVVFVGKDTNITDTASQLGSLIEQWRVNSVVMMALSKTGGLFLPVQGGAGGLIIGVDTQIYRSAADILRTPDSLYVDGIIKVTGSNPGGIGALAGVIDYGNSAGMRLFSYGPDAVTRGIFTLSSQRSDGSASMNVLLSNTQGDLISQSQWVQMTGNSAGSNPQGVSSGLAIGWNVSGSAGEVDFLSHKNGGPTGGFYFYDWNSVTKTLMFQVESFGFTVVNNGQIINRFNKTSTAKVWRLQTDMLVTDDFGIFNQTTSVCAFGARQDGQSCYTRTDMMFIGAGATLNLRSGGNTSHGGNGLGAIGASPAEGLNINGRGSTADIWFGNYNGVTAGYLLTGTVNWVFVGNVSKGSGAFDIVHPLDATKRLRHSFIEGPRYDLIYRGRTTVVGGTAVVNLDTDSGGTGMTAGTFVALTRNPDAWLNRGNVSAAIVGATLTITGTDGPVSWLVIAERQDAHILNDASWNDASGNMKLEYTPPVAELEMRSRIRPPDTIGEQQRTLTERTLNP